MSDPYSRLQRLLGLLRRDPDCSCTIFPHATRPILQACPEHREFIASQVADGNLVETSDGYTVPLVRP